MYPSPESRPSPRLSLPFVLLISVVVSLILFVGFVSGSVFQQRQIDSSGDAQDRNLREFLTAYHLVTQRSYFQPVNKQHLIYAAIDGMLAATGDPHTLFLSPPQNRAADTQLNGARFSGIGAIVMPHGGNLEIVTPLHNTPASRAGLKAGDIVVRINGVRVSGMASDVAVAMIHGSAGSTVHLTVLRSHSPPLEIAVRRAQIPPVTAYGRILPNHLGYLQIFSFGDKTSAEVAGAMAEFRSQHVRGVIIDLRQNPGGYVDAAQQVVSQFVNHGVVAYERGSNGKLTSLPVLHHDRVASFPLALLVDSGTASAAEITAGALHDYGRARLFGARTYGKGSMQSVYSLTDGSSIRITDRLWLTPKKHSIQQTGITPDVVVSGRSPANVNSDPQLTAAERYIERLSVH